MKKHINPFEMLFSIEFYKRKQFPEANQRKVKSHT